MLKLEKIILTVGICLMPVTLPAEDTWPMYRCNVRRSGVTSDPLKFPLKQIWHHDSPPPEQAWTGPAKWDAYSGNSGLQSMRNFDPCYYVTGEGESVYFGSSADNAVHCLDAATGKRKWMYFTDAAVRQPPTLHQGLALAGSDDGYVYAIRMSDGTLAWKKLAAPSDHRIPSNGKLISLWPVRTGVMVHEGLAYFAASLAPWESSVLWSVKATTGKVGEAGTWRRDLQGVTLQGACLIGPDRLYAPQGRSSPLVYGLADGKPMGAVGGAGGVFCLLDDYGRLIAGPQNQRAKDDQIKVVDPMTKQQLVTFNGAARVVIADDFACVQSGPQLRCFDYRKNTELRKQQLDSAGKIKALQKQIVALKKPAPAKKPSEKPDAKPPTIEELNAQMLTLKKEADVVAKELQSVERWKVDFPAPHDLIVAGNTVIAGIDGEVRALSKEDGSVVWSAKVKGRAMGLTVVGGRLFVSTDRGDIYAYSTE